MGTKPDWWPTNPYPESIFPMSREQYPKIVPDPELRTALSGMLGREFWNIASEAIWAAMLEVEKVLIPDAELLQRLGLAVENYLIGLPVLRVTEREQMRMDAEAALTLAQMIWEEANVDEK